MKYKKAALPILVFMVLSFAYCSMLPQTVFWQDAGIYITGIAVEGNIYPPGFPLYMILGNIWNRIIPIQDTTLKVHLISVITGALSASVFFIVSKILLNKNNTLFNSLNRLGEDKSIEKNEEKLMKGSRKHSVITTAVALVTTAFYGLNYNVAAQSINAEVYAPHILLVLTIILLLFLIGINGKIEKNLSSKNKRKVLIIGFALGIALGVHPMAVILIFVLGIFILVQRNILFHPKLLITTILITIVTGALPYVYLPVTALKQPVLNWGNPSTPERFIAHIKGGNYLTGEESIVFTDITRYYAIAQEIIWDFGIIGLIAIGYGVIYIARKNQTLSIILICIVVSHVFFAIVYKQTSEYNAWLIPALAVMTMYLAIALNHIALESSNAWTKRNYSVAVLLAGIAICIVGNASIKLIQTYNELDRTNYWYAEDFGKNILRNLDTDSLILMTGDQESSTTMYLQYVKKFRTDIITLKNIEFEELTYEEGRKAIKKRYPQLIIPQTATDQEDFLKELVEVNLQHRSVYLMSKSIIELDSSEFSLVPAAAMWKVEKSAQPIDLKYWDLRYHDKSYMHKKERPLMSLKDPTKPGGINRVPFIRHMINFELQSWKNLGDWYFNQGDCLRANDAYLKMEKVEKGITETIQDIKSNIEFCKEPNVS